MSGIRASYLPPAISGKDLKIHFLNHKNGGGPIKAIYFPLFDNSAVIIFEDEITAETVKRHKEHVIKGQAIYVSPLTSLPIYPKLHAELDPTVASIIQASDEIRDEIEHCGDLKLNVKDGAIESISGDWFQLEWVWAMIDRFTRHQSHIQHRIQQKIDRSKSTEQEYDVSKKYEASGSLGSKEASDGNPSDSVWDLDDDVKLRPPPMSKEGHHAATMTAQISGDASRAIADTVQTQTFELELEKGGTKSAQKTVTSQATHKSQITHKSQSKSAELNEPGACAMSGTEIEIFGNQDTVLSLDFKYGEVKVSVYAGLITMEETDVIVNAAMGPLVNGAGVAWAIASNASEELQKQCDDYVKSYGPVATSGVIHTVAGGKLSPNVKHVIHAVGPLWDRLNQDDKCMRQLTLTFFNSLTYGNEELGVSSISFPLISSGIFGCPVEVCTKSFLYAIVLFGSQYPDAGLKEIHLVNNDENNTGLTVASLREMIQKGSEHLLDRARRMIKENDGAGSSIDSMTRVAGQKLSLDYKVADRPTLVTIATKGHNSVNTKPPADGNQSRPLPPTPNTSVTKITVKGKK